MNNTDILNKNIIDLKVGIDFAEVANNDNLKDYAKQRIDKIMSDAEISQFLPVDILVDSYVVDLVLFLKSSNILNDKESKEYFRARLSDLIDSFSYLNNRDDLKALL